MERDQDVQLVQLLWTESSRAALAVHRSGTCHQACYQICCDAPSWINEITQRLQNEKPSMQHTSAMARESDELEARASPAAIAEPCPAAAAFAMAVAAALVSPSASACKLESAGEECERALVQPPCAQGGRPCWSCPSR